MKSGTGSPASFIARCFWPSRWTLGSMPRWPPSSASLKLQVSSPSFGTMPKMSKLVTIDSLLMAASIHSRRASLACFLQFTLKRDSASPGYFLPQPRVRPQSLAEPKGICANAGKDSAISSSVQMKPLPVSLRPSSARVLSARRAAKRIKRVKEAVPSPPPEMIRGRAPIALASLAAAQSSNLSRSSRPPRRWSFTTSMMLKNRS
mmetsp:Transcript_10676/g.25168  ORF Transcript_10676/g.25168 Transcript_10676/m.25168 type:complete len:205 (-) Transcript_10676:626-1240(-)